MKLALNNSIGSLFVLFFFVFSSTTIGDNISESLLISYVGPHVIPALLIANSIILFFVSIFLMEIVDRIDRGKLFIIILFTHMFFLLCLKFLSDYGISVESRFSDSNNWIFYVIYSYSYVSKIISFLLFWTIANDILDSRTAKHGFPTIAAGGVSGAVIISFSIIFINKVISNTSNLFFFWIILVFISSLIMRYIYIKNEKLLYVPAEIGTEQENKFTRLANSIKIVKNEALIKSMFVIYFLVFILLIGHEYFFLFELNSTFKNEFPPIELAAQISSFLALFKGISNILTIIIQFTVARYIIKKVKTVHVNLIFPVIAFFLMLLIFISNFLPNTLMGIYPFFNNFMFLIITISLSLRIMVFDSIFSPNFQLFFSSLPKNIRGRGKLLLEGISKPASITITGLLILFFFKEVNAINSAFLVIVALLLVIWSLRMRKTYSDSIFKTLEGDRKQKIEKLLSLSSSEITDETVVLLADYLEEKDNEIRSFIITFLGRIGSKKAVEIIINEYSRSDDLGKSIIISIMGEQQNPDFMQYFKMFLEETDDRVLANTIDAIRNINKPELLDPTLLATLTEFLKHKTIRIRANAIIALWKLIPEESFRKKLRDELSILLNATDKITVSSAVYALGEIADNSLVDLLYQATNNPHLNRKGIGRFKMSLALIAISKFKSIYSVSLLISYLPFAGKKERILIKKGLAQQIVFFPELFKKLCVHQNYEIRIIIIDSILDGKQEIPQDIKDFLKTRIDIEIHHIYSWIYKTNRFFIQNNSEEAEVLKEIIFSEVIKNCRNMIIKLVHLCDDSVGIINVLSNLESKDKHKKSNIIELIENTLSSNHAKTIIPLCEDINSQTVLDIANNIISKENPTNLEIWDDILDLSNSLVKTFAVYISITTCTEDVQKYIFSKMNFSGQETAVRYLRDNVYGIS